jgi:hypothetical protein
VPGRLTRARRGAGTNRALGLSNELFVLGDSVVLTVLSQVAFMPVLVLAARLCPEVRPRAASTLPSGSALRRATWLHFLSYIGSHVHQSSREMPVWATACLLGGGGKGMQVIDMGAPDRRWA